MKYKINKRNGAGDMAKQLRGLIAPIGSMFL